MHIRHFCPRRKKTTFLFSIDFSQLNILTKFRLNCIKVHSKDLLYHFGFELLSLTFFLKEKFEIVKHTRVVLRRHMEISIFEWLVFPERRENFGMLSKIMSSRSCFSFNVSHSWYYTVRICEFSMMKSDSKPTKLWKQVWVRTMCPFWCRLCL